LFKFNIEKGIIFILPIMSKDSIMADIEGIARRIYDIIISPETVPGLINGGLSVPLDKAG